MSNLVLARAIRRALVTHDLEALTSAYLTLRQQLDDQKAYALLHRLAYRFYRLDCRAKTLPASTTFELAQHVLRV